MKKNILLLILVFTNIHLIVAQNKDTIQWYRLSDLPQSKETAQWNMLRDLALEGSKKEILYEIKNGLNIDLQNKYGETVLAHLAKMGDYKKIQLLLDCGAAVDKPDKDGNSPLILSCYLGERERINTINRVFRDGGTNIVIFLSNQEKYSTNYLKTVRTLIEYGANINYLNINGDSPLHFAVKTENESNPLYMTVADSIEVREDSFEDWVKQPFTHRMKIVKLLLDSGAMINKSNKSGKTPLRNSYSNDINRLLIDNGADINSQDIYGGILLRQYINRRNWALIDLLIENDVEVNENKINNPESQISEDKTNDNVLTLFIDRLPYIKSSTHSSSEGTNPFTEEYYPIFDYLIKKFDDQKIIDSLFYFIENDTKYIVFYQYPELVKILAKRANLDALFTYKPYMKEIKNNTAFHIVLNRVPASVDFDYCNTYSKIFLEAGADPTIRNSEGESPFELYLMNSRRYGSEVDISIIEQFFKDKADICLSTFHQYDYDPEIYDLYFKYNGNVNCRDGDDDDTLLMYAVRSSNFELVKKLLENGADPYLKNIDGYTALDLARDKEVKKLLKNHLKKR